LLDVVGLVAAHASPNNNAAVPLDPTALDMPAGAATIDLPCGEYYLTAINLPTVATINIHGRAALYVGGDITASDVRINPDPGAEVDVFAAGNLIVNGALTLGPSTRPSAVRVYVGGTTVHLASASTSGGYVYAPHADFTADSALNLYGGLFVGGYMSGASTTVHYDTSIARAGNACGVAAESDVASTTCAVTANCPTMQACTSGVCGPCTLDSECRTGQVCVMGTCQ
jgi:hypothetical protein